MFGASSWASAVRSDEGTRAFWQGRIASLCLIVGTLAALFFVVSLAVFALYGFPPGMVFAQPGVHWQLATNTGLFLAWGALRVVRVPARYLPWVDACVTVATCAGFTGIGVDFQQDTRQELVLLLVMSYVLITRAAVVPSSGAWTLLVGLPSLVPMLVLTFVQYRGLVGTPYQRSPVLTTTYVAIWALIALSLTVTISRIMYGLRREAEAARQLGQYTLEEKIGAGGMGEVYRARHALLRRPTAIKLLSGSGAQDMARFEREVQLTAMLTHPNTIAVYDYGRADDGTFYYAMEYLQGLTLEDLVERHGPMPPGRVVRVLTQICGALAEAHAIGLIHRDVKPANVMLCERGGVPDVAKVLDFGLVKEAREEDAALTRSGAVTGTPLYLSPEAIVAPDGMDARSDLYGVGAVGYFLLTGGHVFTGANIVEVCAHHLHTPPVPPSKHRPVPEDLKKIILACLEKKPAARPPDARAVMTALACCESTWTDEDARAWWNECKPAVRSAPSRDSSAVKTLGVSLPRAVS